MDNDKTFIPEDYEGLLNQYNNLKTELDVVKQHLYDSTRQAKLSEALLKDYQNEIDQLQKGEIVEKEKWESKFIRLEGTLTNLRLKHSEDIACLEAELTEKEQENENLKNQIELLKQSDFFKEQRVDISTHLDETLNLKNNYELLIEKHEELEEVFEILQNQQLQSEKVIDQYKQEVEELKELLNAKRNEVAEYAVLNEKLNEDLLCAQRELDINRSKPLEEDSKGNSLFAEVDDRRVYLQKTINDMKADYIQMKQEKGDLIKQISNLRKENADIQRMWKKDLEQIEEDKQSVSDSLQSHLKILQNIIDKQKVELEEKPKSTGGSLSLEYQFYQDMIDSKHKEVKNLEQKLSEKSLGEYLLTSSLAQANKEIRQLRLKVMENDVDSNKEASKDILQIKTQQAFDDVRTRLRSCLKPKENLSQDQNHEETLNFNQPQDSSVNTFNIFHNRETTKQIPSNVVLESKISRANIEFAQVDEPVSDEPPLKTTFDEEKENCDLHTEQPTKVKKAVTFTDDTIDTDSRPIRRRGTRVFSAPKMMF